MEEETGRLINACLAGDERAAEQLVHQYETGVFRLTFSVLCDEGEANDAAQDTFIAMLASLASYKPQQHASFKAWVYRIALNTSLSRLRKRKALERLRKSIETVFLLQREKTPGPEEIFLRGEENTLIRQAISALDEKHRLPLILRYYHELGAAEIAEILHTNEGTVYSRLHYGRERIRLALERNTGVIYE
jgi:RNA polymerase sigma-70 factor (ECF subfamily)